MNTLSTTSPQNVPRGTLSTLQHYEAMLKDWQERMNLVSNNTLDQAWQRHFEDSLQLLPLLPEKAGTLFDIGSGAGFPGLVIAICRPDLNVHLIESTGKKCNFLTAVAQECGAENVVIHNMRIEDIAKTESKNVPRGTLDVIPDVVTARALAALDQLFTYCLQWAKANPALTLIFPKGKRADEELEKARTGWDFELETRPSATDAEAKILVIRKLRKKR